MTEIREMAPADMDLSLGRLRQFPEPRVVSMMASLRNKGQLSPLVAASHPDTLVLVDGFIRHSAAMRLALPSVFVAVHELGSVQMKAQMYLRNRQRGLLLIEECRLVDELHRIDGMNQVEIATVLERHKSWVSRRLALHQQLSPHLMEEMAIGRLGMGSIQTLAQLPARNQEELFAVSQQAGLNRKDTARLIGLWRRAQDDEMRRYVLEQPIEALRLAHGKHGQPADEQNVVLQGTMKPFFKTLSVWSSASNRLLRLLRDPIATGCPSHAIKRLTEEVKLTHAQGLEAVGAMESWLQQHGDNA